MASNSKRMTAIVFTSPSVTRHFMVQAYSDYVFYVDPNFFKIWSGDFRRFLENSSERQPQFYPASVTGESLLTFLKLIHSQALVNANDYTEINDFINTLDRLDAPQCLKEAAAFQCFFRIQAITDIQSVRLFIKSLILADGKTACQLLQHFNEELVRSHYDDFCGEVLNVELAEWILAKGVKQVSKQILSKQAMQAMPQQQLSGKVAAFNLCFDQIQESLNSEPDCVSMDVEFDLAAKSVLSNRCLLSNQSAVFQSMLYGDFDDRSQQSIPLPEETEEKFHHVMFSLLLPTFAGTIWRFKTDKNE